MIAALRRLRRRGRPAAAPRPLVVTHAERAECTCPDACERDHDLD